MVHCTVHVCTMHFGDFVRCKLFAVKKNVARYSILTDAYCLSSPKTQKLHDEIQELLLKCCMNTYYHKKLEQKKKKLLKEIDKSNNDKEVNETKNDYDDDVRLIKYY